VFVHLAENVRGVAENLVALEFRLEPIGRTLFDLEGIPAAQIVA